VSCHRSRGDWAICLQSLKGPGWGGMPLHAVKQDLLDGRLAKLSIEDLPEEGMMLPMSAGYITANPPGPAGRWLIERLKQCSGQRAAVQRVAQSRSA
jgi:DNA-binding transcriptional LysR family regulator